MAIRNFHEKMKTSRRIQRCFDWSFSEEAFLTVFSILTFIIFKNQLDIEQYARKLFVYLLFNFGFAS
ncbi:MAG: hypothetical protein QG670_1221 [Thermoproteota archaeon]|nr:hypothetical protein [Thermoproteota archaeon]